MFGAETKKYLKIGLIAAVLVVLVQHFNEALALFWMLTGAASPLLMGGVIAYILNILLRQVEKWYFPNSKKPLVIKTRRIVCILLSILLLLLAVFLVVWVVVPELVSSIKLIGREIPPVVEKLMDWLVRQSSALPELNQMLSSLEINWPDTLRKVANLITSGAGGVINSVVSVVSTTIGAVTTFVIGLIFALYLLMNKEKLLRQGDKLMRAYLKPKTHQRIVYLLTTANQTFSAFIVGQCTEAVILGALCTVGMLLFRFPYAAMTGAVVGVTALIPIVGAYIGAAVGAFMIFTQDPFQAVLFLIFLVVLQQLEGNLIYPRVVGTSIGLPGIWVLAAVTIGSGIMGIPGMLLGVPTAATLYKLLGTDVNKRLRQKAAASPSPLPDPAAPVKETVEDRQDGTDRQASLESEAAPVQPVVSERKAVSSAQNSGRKRKRK